MKRLDFDQNLIIGKLITTPAGIGRIYRVSQSERGITIRVVEKKAGKLGDFEDYTYLDKAAVASSISVAYSTGDEILDAAYTEALRQAMHDRIVLGGRRVDNTTNKGDCYE